MDYNLMNESFHTMFSNGMFGMIFGAVLIISLIISLGLYIYFALAWQTIARKLKYKNAWLAWIPIANMALILELGDFNWAWIFLLFIPFLGWIAVCVLTIIATWKAFEKRKYPGWFSLSIIIPWVGMILYLISIGFVAWENQKKKR